MIDRGKFFEPGGTLPPGSASYVTRRADEETTAALLASEFVFILDSRQKGKSSLIVRSLERLHERGITTLRIDLQRLGTNLQPEQWYAGLLHSIGQELNLTADLFRYWKEHTEFGPSFRFFGAIEEVVLPSTQGPVVVFVDEVDFVQALPFSTDEFFAAIRECYNRRAASPEFRRLSFCLAGVAAPSQLIHNEDVTPFNVGRRIELTDFTREETVSYANELSRQGRDGNRILNRIHDWVAGHPYLTQLLASQVVADPDVLSARDVDALVHRTLLSAEARQREPNIADAERRLLETSIPGASKEESRSRLLEVYRALLGGNLVSSSHEESLISTILLSGIAVEEAGTLRIRNRLYRTLFDERWRRNNLPDAEARRQRAASARAAWKVAWVSLSIIGFLSAMFVWLLILTRDRDNALAESRRLSRENNKIAYQTSMAFASDLVQEGSLQKAVELLKRQEGSSEREWEWEYLNNELVRPTVVRRPTRSASAPYGFRVWTESGVLAETIGTSLCLDGRVFATLPTRAAVDGLAGWLQSTKGTGSLESRAREVLSIFDQQEFSFLALSPNKKIIARVKSAQSRLELLDRFTGRSKFLRAPFPINRCGFSRNGSLLQVAAVHEALTYNLHKSKWFRFSGTISPGEKYLVMASGPESRQQVLRTEDGSLACQLIGHTSPSVDEVWFSDEKRLATYGRDGTVRIWQIPEGKQIAVYATDQNGTSLGLSPDEHSLVLTTREGGILSWPVKFEPAVVSLPLHRKDVCSVVVSPDSHRFLTTSQDGIARLIDIPSLREIASYDVGSFFETMPVVFSLDGTLMTMVGPDGTIYFVHPLDGSILRRVRVPGKHPFRTAYSRSNALAFVLREEGMLTMASWQAKPIFYRPEPYAGTRVVFSMDGSQLAIASSDGRVALIDSKSMKPLREFRPSTNYMTGVEFSPDGRWLSASSRDQNAYIFPLNGSTAMRTLAGHAARVWQARFSPDSRFVLTNSFDDTARVWEVKTGKLVSILHHDSWVCAAEWSPNGRRIVTGCADHCVRIFDPENGFELLKLRGHEGYVLDVHFTPDGKSLVSGSQDHTVRVWRTVRRKAIPASIASGTRGRPVPGTRVASGRGG